MNSYPLRMGRFGFDRTDVRSNHAQLVTDLARLPGPDFWHCAPRDPQWVSHGRMEL
jgi:hypothetical protein